MRPLIIANWKLHGGTAFTADLLSQLTSRLADIKGVDVVICPPFVYLPQAKSLLDGSGVTLGAQHVSDQQEGAYTGEVSASMLREMGCDYVIVGHSERRHLYAEDDDSTTRRVSRALDAGLIPILCVGETLAQRKLGTTNEVIASQLAAVSDEIPADARYVVAYEPVWAIGTGQTPSMDQFANVQAIIRAQLGKRAVGEVVRVIYGGSITPDNVAEIFAIDGIEGGLVGGASLDSESFYRIVRYSETNEA